MKNRNSMFDLHSVLQKAIRRGDEKEALLASWQLDAETGVVHTKGRAGSMWSILRRITAEDIGLANLAAPQTIETLWHFWQKQLESFRNAHEPWRLFTVEAVMILCASPKSRRVDHACITLHPTRLDGIVAELRAVQQPYPIPCYAHDGIHTGMKTGSTQADFILGEDAVLNNKMEIEDPFKEQIDSAILQFRRNAQ